MKDRYEIIRELGQGGGAIVYLVRDLMRSRQEVVLKVFLPGIIRSNDAVKRLRREADVLMQASHECILEAYDFFEEQNFVAYTREYVEGGDLRSVINKAPLQERQIIEMLIQIAKGMCAIHSAGYIHRDLKPENILVNTEQRVKISDFGMTVRKGEENNTDTEVAAGRYQAPEIGTCPADFLCDIYAIGAMGLEMLGSNSAPRLRPVLDRAAAADRSVRQQSVQELLQDLTNCAAKSQGQAGFLKVIKSLLKWA